MVKDPLDKLREKMKPKNLSFSLRTVTEEQIKKTMDQMKKKKSAGQDGISQESLLLGAEVLAIPLTRVINASIESGIFTGEWKEGVVTPIKHQSCLNKFAILSIPFLCCLCINEIDNKLLQNQKILYCHSFITKKHAMIKFVIKFS